MSDLPDLLNLSSLQVVAVADDGAIYTVKAKRRIAPVDFSCPRCGSARPYGHGSHWERFMDAPSHGRRVQIEIERRRYRCRSCGKTFFEPLPDLDDKRRITARLAAYIEERCLKRTFLGLAREVGLDEKSVRNIAHDYLGRLSATTRFETPEFMGMDEIKVLGDYRAVITNVGKNTLYDILPTRRQSALMRYFSVLPDRERVRWVAMDMWKPYRNVAGSCLPGARIVVDKFHIQRMANEALERVRKGVRKEVSTRERLQLKDDRFLLLRRARDLDPWGEASVQDWSRRFPRLGQAHALKERFFDIWEATGRAEAQARYALWKASIPAELREAFEPLLVAMDNWEEPIFNYFERRITNAYTESINSLIRGVNRMGRGYSFEVLRARLLYNAAVGSTSGGKKTSVRGKTRRTSATNIYQYAGHLPADLAGAPVVQTKFGPSLATLARLLHAGHFETPAR